MSFSTKALILTVLIANFTILQAGSMKPEDPAQYWDFRNYEKPPAYQIVDFPESRYPQLKQILFDGSTWQGKATKVFAYVGIPDGPVPSGGFPGIVLVHGGGGTAYGWAAELWKSYGYAVIAIDWYNQRPADLKGIKRIPLEGGMRPIENERGGIFNPVCIFNVGEIIRANSLLRSMPQINPDKIALVGLSWGARFTAMAASVDPRFRCAVCIYCGGVRQSNIFFNGRFLHAAKVPVYWISGTNDKHCLPEMIQQGVAACAKTHNRSMYIELTHGHEGFTFAACKRVADHFLKGEPDLPKLGKNTIQNGVISTPVINEGKGIKRVMLCYTTDREANKVELRKWQSVPAEYKDGVISAKLPKHVFVCFLAAVDEDSQDFRKLCLGSGDIEEFPRTEK